MTRPSSFRMDFVSELSDLEAAVTLALCQAGCAAKTYERIVSWRVKDNWLEVSKYAATESYAKDGWVPVPSPLTNAPLVLFLRAWLEDVSVTPASDVDSQWEGTHRTGFRLLAGENLHTHFRVSRHAIVWGK